MDAQTTMGLMGHMVELRRRLIICLIGLTIGSAIAFVFRDFLLTVLTRQSPGFRPVYLELTEMLGVYMKLSLLGGFILALPLTIYQAAMFLVPALLPQERRSLFLLLPGVLILFLLGVSFAYFVLIPPALNFLLSFGSDVAQPQIRVSNYFSVVVTLLFWLGVVFEIPFVLFILARIKLVSAQTLSKYRRYAIIMAFVMGALITPTFDPINQTLVSIPIIGLYELGILLARLARRGESKNTDSGNNLDRPPQ